MLNMNIILLLSTAAAPVTCIPTCKEAGAPGQREGVTKTKVVAVLECTV